MHYVNEEYDKGDIIVQAHCPAYASRAIATLAERTHNLAHYFAGDGGIFVGVRRKSFNQLCAD